MTRAQAARSIGEFVRDSKVATGVGGALLGAVIVGATLPGRVSALESEMQTQKTVTRYMGCAMKAVAEGQDPRPCESHLSPDLVDYLRPR